MIRTKPAHFTFYVGEDTMIARPNLIAGCLIAAAMMYFLAVLAVGYATTQQMTPMQVERQIVGTYELAEWHFEGQVLRPPVVNGRLVFHNGQIVGIYSRNSDGTVEDFAGYGSYLVNEKIWSYGYDYRLEVTGKSGENSVVHATREQIPFTYRPDGANLVLDYRNGERRFVFGRDDLTYIVNGQILRRWRRLKTGL
jgi:hypothetical protein